MPFPKTTEALEAAGYKFLNATRCTGKTCGARIEFWQTPQGKRIPLDMETREPHWGTCPNRDDFRKAKK